MSTLNGQPLLRLACWEAHRGPVSGWPDEKLEQVMGPERAGGFDTWPPAARGLPLGERKKLGQFGLHRLDTQLCLLVSNVRRNGDVDVDELMRWMVTGFEKQVWRGADRRILEITHNYRVKRDVAHPLQAANCLGPIYVGLAIAADLTLSVDDVVRQTVRVAQTVYQSYETSVVAGVVAAAVRTGREDWVSVAMTPDRFLAEGIPAATVDALTRADSLTCGTLMSSARTIIRRIDAFMGSTTAQRRFETSATPGLSAQASNHLNTLGHILDDTRSSENALPVDGLIDRARLERYAAALATADEMHESAAAFFEAEFLLSQRERIYQEGMAAERRN